MTRSSFTGTREGMTELQKTAFIRHLQQMSCLIHGACRGADDEADELAALVFVHRIVWPSTASTRVPDEVLQARTRVGSGLTILLPPLPPLVRDRHIVDSGEVLLAAPRAMYEERHSGTWATVRYARKKGVPVIMLWPE